MVETINILKASLQAGKDFLCPSHEGGAEPEVARAPPVLVPIRSLGENHRARIATHLLALESQDRYLRFGFTASDAQVQRYVDSLNFERDEIFGIYNRRLELIAMAHLARACDDELKSCAEFGVSVSKASRGRGYGARLFDRAVMHARNDGVSCLFIHVLSENTAMLKIASNAGALVERDGPESQAHVYIDPATLDTRVSEMVNEQMAQADYRIKVQVKQFWDVLADVQALRRDVQESQKITPK